MNIFNISQEIEDIFCQIEENGGEITPELEERLAISEDLLQDKLDSYRRVHSRYLAEAKICKEEESRIAKLRKSKENQAERLKDVMLTAVQKFGSTGKSGNKLINLPDAKLYTKSSACVELNADLVNILKESVLNIWRRANSQGAFEYVFGSTSNDVLLKMINDEFEANHPDIAAKVKEQYGHLFTISDLWSLNLKFEFNFNIIELNGYSTASVILSYLNNEDIDDSVNVTTEVNKINIKNKIVDGEAITFANLVNKDSLIIK